MPSSPAGIEARPRDLLDLEVLADAAAEPLLGVGVEVGEQAVGGEDREAGVLERDQAISV